MARRLLAVALVIGLGGWTVSAQGRTTFVLTDGERVSGALSSRGTVNGNQLSLAVPGEPDRIFRNGEVAAIEFGGGAPRANELSALPSGGQMIALRSGETRPGYLITIVGGTTVRWQDQGGSTRNIPVRDVARIYLNARSARNAYASPADGDRYSSGGYNGGYSRGGAGYSGYDSRASNANGQSRGYGSRNNFNNNNLANPIDIPGHAPWTDTGIDVMRGDLLRFDAQGQVTFIQGANSAAGPAGGAAKSQRYPVPSAGVGALIAKVGNSGTPFLVGDNRNTVTMPATGRLWLGVNDDDFNDNAGSFKVTVIRGQ
jgi:hypothetical protein